MEGAGADAADDGAWVFAGGAETDAAGAAEVAAFPFAGVLAVGAPSGASVTEGIVSGAAVVRVAPVRGALDARGRKGP